MKDEKEILTQQIVFKKLMYEAKRSVVGCLLMCVLGAVFFGMLSLILLSPSYVTVITKIIVGILSSLYFIVCAFFFVRALLRMIKAKQGAFTVVEDVLTEIKDNQFSLIQLIIHGGFDALLGNKAHLNHVFHFQSGKIFIANVEQYKNTRLGTAAEFSLPGDNFFLVFYNDSPNKIVLLFSSKIYTYKNEK
jgi:hypothetical protein